MELSGRRAEIVAAAYHQVAAVGFEGLRLRQIAEDAGIDHSTLHHHFPGKKDIVAGVAAYAIGRFAAAQAQETDPAAALRGYFAHLSALFARSPEVFVVTAELDLRARRDPLVCAVMDEHEDNWRGWLRGLLAAGAEAGTLAPGADVDGAVELVIAVVKGVQLTPGTAAAAFAQLEELLT